MSNSPILNAYLESTYGGNRLFYKFSQANTTKMQSIVVQG